MAQGHPHKTSAPVKTLSHTSKTQIFLSFFYSLNHQTHPKICPAYIKFAVIASVGSRRSDSGALWPPSSQRLYHRVLNQIWVQVSSAIGAQSLSFFVMYPSSVSHLSDGIGAHAPRPPAGLPKLNSNPPSSDITQSQHQTRVWKMNLHLSVSPPQQRCFCSKVAIFSGVDCTFIINYLLCWIGILRRTR